jgi:hypothetical protein
VNLLWTPLNLAALGVLAAQLPTPTEYRMAGRVRVSKVKREACRYRGYSKLRTHTALGSYGRARPRGKGPPYGRCVSLISSNPCIEVLRTRQTLEPFSWRHWSHWSDRSVNRSRRKTTNDRFSGHPLSSECMQRCWWVWPRMQQFT